MIEFFVKSDQTSTNTCRERCFYLKLKHPSVSWCPEWRQHEDDRRRAEDRPTEGPLGPFELNHDQFEDEDNSSEDKDDDARLQYSSPSPKERLKIWFRFSQLAGKMATFLS